MTKVYSIEVYETWTSKYEVHAENIEDAIAKYQAGEGSILDNTNEFVETDLSKSREFKFDGKLVNVESIRDIEVIDEYDTE